MVLEVIQRFTHDILALPYDGLTMDFFWQIDYKLSKRSFTKKYHG